MPCIRLRAEHEKHIWTYDFVQDNLENGYIKSFNSKMRDEFLNREIFRNMY